jgi:predicted DNA-binding ribbon-helix-helix protein
MGMLNDLDGLKKSTLVSRNITVVGRRTSVRLEPEMWNALREIARREQCKIHDICSLIHLRKNPATSLTAAIRVFLMLYYRAAATEDGHSRARHGNFDQMVQRARMTPDMLKKQAAPSADRPNESAAVDTANVSHIASVSSPHVGAAPPMQASSAGGASAEGISDGGDDISGQGEAQALAHSYG